MPDRKISSYIVPMFATSVDKPFNSDEWLFELKLDGFRAVADLRKKPILLYSRNGLSLRERYPVVAEALMKQKLDAVLDGEIVLLNEEGKADFQKLQNYGNNRNNELVYYAFDILNLNGKDLTGLPLTERKKILKKALKKSAVVRYSDHVEDKGKDFFKLIIDADMEGMMAKKKDSLYTPGIRTKEWLKVKFHKSQEAIIVGFTEPKGGRLHFGSILLSQYKNEKLEYIGNAGTGFTDQTLRELMKKLQPLITDNSPFDKKIKANGPVTWVKPQLVCEVSYSEITKDGMLRHPVYKGLRPEKKSSSIKMKTEREVPVKRIVHSQK
jgi:bifunctional non-homologous end joining protein LigD